MPYIRTYYGLYFSGSGGVVRLPINPEKLPITYDNDNKEYNVLGIGPIMVPRTPKLAVGSISGGLLPGRGGDVPPETYIDFFRAAMANMEVVVFTPVRFYETGEPFASSDVGFECLITEFVYEERGGETGDFYYDLTWTEFRDYTPQRMQVASGGGYGASDSAGAASASARARMLTGASSSVQQPATASQDTLRLLVEPSRAIPQGQLYSGAYAVANGAAYQTSQRGGSSQQLSGQLVRVQRIDNTAPSGVFVITEAGEYIGWMEATALQVVDDR